MSRSNRRTPRLEILEDRAVPAFVPGADIVVGDKPMAVVVGDFNRDRKVDLAVVSNVGDSVDVLLGKGNGTFRPVTKYSIGATAFSPVSIKARDVNGDGKLDLVTANSGSNNI